MGWGYFSTDLGYYLLRNRNKHLRSQNGQNGQILFISGEQLSLIVAGDSAKTLSVLGNRGGVDDDCGLRFVQIWATHYEITKSLLTQHRTRVAQQMKIALERGTVQYFFLHLIFHECKYNMTS